MATSALVACVGWVGCGARTPLDFAPLVDPFAAPEHLDAALAPGATQDASREATLADAGFDAPLDAPHDAAEDADAGRSCGSGPGCLAVGCACTTNAECCTSVCVNGTCRLVSPFSCGGLTCTDSTTEYCLTTVEGTPAPDDAGGIAYACADLPQDCRAFPPTCACLLPHAPCAPYSPPDALVQCTAVGGALSLLCGNY